jgi:hypothetical protein
MLKSNMTGEFIKEVTDGLLPLLFWNECGHEQKRIRKL